VVETDDREDIRTGGQSPLMEKCKPCSELFTLLSNAVTKLSTGIRREEPSMVREGGEEIKRVVSADEGDDLHLPCYRGCS